MELLTDPTLVKEYFKKYCEEHKEIAHSSARRKFYEWKDGLTGNNMNYTACVMLPVDMKLVDKLSDNVHFSFSFDLWLLESTKKDDDVSRREAEAKCFSIAKDFIARLRFECVNTIPNKPRVISYMDFNTVKTEVIGPFGSANACGISLSGSFSNPGKIKHDSNKWNN